MEKLIGKVSHFYDKISVAIITLSEDLPVGSSVRFRDEKTKTDFTQTVDSLQINHQEINPGKAGTAVGLKTTQPVRVGTEVLLG